MAEALTLIGGLAAIMQLAGSVVKLTKELRVCVRTIRSAPKEIEDFILQTSIFTDLLCYFHEVAKESAAVMNENSKAKRAKVVRQILRQCKSVKRGFAHLVRRFIDINGADTASLNTLWARLMWLWKRPDVPELRLNLQSAIANVNLLCNLFTFEELKTKNADSEKIEMLQVQLQNWIAIARKQRRELAEYKKRKVSLVAAPEIVSEEIDGTIEENSRQLEKYVVNAIRSYSQREAVSTGVRSSHSGPQGPTIQKPRYVPFKQTPDELIEERDLPMIWEEQPSLMMPSGQLSERIVGNRVTDEGHNTILEISAGPVEEVAHPNMGSDIAIELEAPDRVPQKINRPYDEEVPQVSEQDSGPEETELPRTSSNELSEVPHYGYLDGRSERVDPSEVASKSSPATQLEGSEVSHNSLREERKESEESCGPYIAVAPFGGPRSRKRLRRPRPQSPIG
ncbi:hypothetical protein F4811DRAFT_556618 [Daldinia bambusicola]|nr:hypothetical protein F4811DRAFT_556618 [Daldinia bambusicola]